MVAKTAKNKNFTEKDREKQELQSVIFAPIMVLIMLALISSIFTEKAGVVLLVIFGGVFVYQGIYYIFLAEKKRLFSGLYMLAWGILFSIPVAVAVLSFLGF